ncbi:LysR family transcriptional regulator [Sphingomonas sp. AR_OL41]|uniref:LysR family transcriptional regulator n=1 Tax=Sphingomonas sp. AR_OL41 TaxID=3042729 RepID=UPI0024814B62|nr:LysR family transcriptional regulator [Sphingomonas sp. AR_OL41]MDH7973264.1 LysR family transcriptional regulator [Sphingomonas sp. AR_OL41]
MEIQQLRHLIAAVENRNLLKAADKAYISQSGLSRSLKSLEHRLGVPLLIRGPKGVEPTIYGLAVIRRAKVILNEVTRSMEEVRAIEHGRIGETTFGITQNYANYMMPTLLAQLHVERPGLKVSILTDGFLELVKKVKTEEIDFAFGLIGRIHHSDGLIIEPLMENRSRVIVGSHHPLVTKEAVSIDDLSRAQWAMLSSESVQRGFGLFFETRGLAVPPQMLKSNSIALIRHVVEASNALTILPQDVVQPEINSGLLVALDCETPVERTRIGLIFRDGGLITPQAEVVVNRIREVVARRALEYELNNPIMATELQ